MIHAGVLRSFALGLENGHVPTYRRRVQPWSSRPPQVVVDMQTNAAKRETSLTSMCAYLHRYVYADCTYLHIHIYTHAPYLGSPLRALVNQCTQNNSLYLKTMDLRAMILRILEARANLRS